MKIYIVEEGCCYDGLVIQSIHRTENGAVLSAKNIVGKSKMYSYVKNPLQVEDEKGLLHRWIDESYEHDVLIIKEYDVQP